MCPFCLSALGSIVAGSMSTGGLAALAVKISRKKSNRIKVQNPRKKENANDDKEK
jgi:hypothetical protein